MYILLCATEVCKKGESIHQAAFSGFSVKMSHLKLEAKIESLPNLSNFINSQCDSHLVSPENCFSIMLVVEELVTNICYYAYPNREGDFEVDMEFLSDRCLIKIVDSGNPFDPTKAQKPDTTSSLEERKIGGLGLFFVRENSDKFQYERVGNKNIVRITKLLGRA